MDEALAFSFQLVGGIVGFTVIVMSLAALPQYLEDRALIRLAKSYGIEHVPGEDLRTLRRKVLEHRDRTLG